jgi:phage baseplate assembly protein W
MSLITNVSGGVATVIVPASNSEIDIPFRIGTTGGVATTSDTFQKALAHLLSIAMTRTSERVMRPTYGVGLQSMVFEDSNALSFQQAGLALQTAFSASESAVATVSVAVVQQGATFVFQVDFTVNQDPTVHRAIFNFAGQLVGST